MRLKKHGAAAKCILWEQDPSQRGLRVQLAKDLHHGLVAHHPALLILQYEIDEL